MALFSSRPPFNDDPWPYIAPGGSRHAHPGTINFGERLVYNPRPEFDRPQNNPTNLILARLREEWSTPGRHENDLALCADRVLASCVEESEAVLYYNGDEIDHARRVLTRLARFQED